MRNVCFKKSLVVGIIVLFIGVNIVSGIEINGLKNMEKKPILLDDELDQQQPYCDTVIELGYDEEVGVNFRYAT